MKRLIWFVLDSVGIGGAPDAAAFGDEGADTLGHLAEWFVKEKSRPLTLPNLEKLGLGSAYALVHKTLPAGWHHREPEGFFAAATEVSTGKDTPSGHWEMAGVPCTWDWAGFPNEPDCFPSELIEKIHAAGHLEGSLGHCHASGTEVIARLGADSVRTGKPIFYTSADSVFQIAAHEEAFGLERLLQLCETVRELTRESMLGRVIARPFIGEDGNFTRTGNRKDYALEPPGETTLQKFKNAGSQVIGVGKIGDIFAHLGLTAELKASGHPALWQKTREALATTGPGDLVMTNFVDFDQLYGHRRDPEGYGLALEEWDRELGNFLAELGKKDALVITADHGNDPTWPGTDHTRERVPVLVHGGNSGSGGIFPDFTRIGELAWGLRTGEAASRGLGKLDRA